MSSPLPLTQNKYGFDIKADNPFVIFRHLAKIAVAKVGVENVLDLSRGDPGYGFAPNARSRLLFKDNKKEAEADLLEKITNFAQVTYSAKLAGELLKDLDEFINKVIAAAKNQDLNWSKFDILFHIFKYSTVSGGCYHDPYGELMSRIIIADYHTKKTGVKIKYDNLILTAGASHAIGTFFKAFGAEAAEFLQAGDTALITSPVYFPYMGILEARGVKVVTLTIDPNNGQISDEAMAELGAIKPKIIFLIDPDNPTGLAKNEASLKKLADYARKVDALLVSDEVYFSFHEGKKSILEFAPERTIRIDARSKIERATGCRFGEYIILDEANEYLSKNILKNFLPSNTDLRTYLHDAKAPGGVKGEFRHTTFVPGPSQLLGVIHLALGAEERARYISIVKENMRIWYQTLGLDWLGGLYYSMFDMNTLANEAKEKIPAEQKLLDLAERGVVLIPANRFFSVKDRERADRTNYVRGSLPNLTTEQAKKAAEIIRDYLQN